jgi:type II secretory pathway pseudopilin PulG
MKNLSARRGGFTLLETVITIAILVTILGLPTSILQSSSALFRRSSASAGQVEKARGVTDQITDFIARSSSARCGPIPVAPNATTSSVLYTPAVGYGGGTQTVWGTDERIVFEYTVADPNDGLDNDGDGRIDEGRAVQIIDPGTINEQRRILTEDVAEWGAGEIPGNNLDDNGNGWVDEQGLAFGFAGESISVLLTLERVDPQDGLIVYSVERVLTFRNKGV